MEYVLHRVNTASRLRDVQQDWGVEVDVRSNVATGKLHLAHDPFTAGEDFGDWLDAFKAANIHGPIIVNTKEDLLEEEISKLMANKGVSSYIFLDTAAPTFFRFVRAGKGRRFFVRQSQLESLQSAEQFALDVEWVWLDCQGGMPVGTDHARKLKDLGLRICLVSPELVTGEVNDIKRFSPLAAFADSICTKNPERWQKILEGIA